jgi:hypothetical protein
LAEANEKENGPGEHKCNVFNGEVGLVSCGNIVKCSVGEQHSDEST